MKELIHKNDRYHMNWITGNTEWGAVRVPEGIHAEKKTEKTGEIIKEEYHFTNTTDRTISTELKDIAIYTPFEDEYVDAAVCMTQRCHAHIWCGENCSYVLALRMGGEGPHLGLVLTRGSLGGYSVERDISRHSNDRGDFLLHPSPIRLKPGESMMLAWTLFWNDGKQDFYQKLKEYNPNFIYVNAEKYIVFKKEEIEITINPAFDFLKEDICITGNGKQAAFALSGQTIYVREQAAEYGEILYSVSIKGITTHCRIFVLPDIENLAKVRCHFIAEKQQLHDPGSGLDGAYLIYDNEEEKIFYDSENDYNGGRERIGMGILLAKYLQTHEDDVLSDSLSKYTAYVERELFDVDTGTVYNDYHRNNSYHRLYNYPWVSVFYIELYRLYSNRTYLVYAYRALLSFYEQGGTHFYAIEIPLQKICDLLTAENMTGERQTLLRYFREHCDCILENRLSYPAHEVNYEQSIVAPAAGLLLQMYKVTGEEKYLSGAKLQLKVLELFHGFQPDYHLYETAIRHWDGYWFGKRRMYGDTFPHYWSALSANVFFDYAAATKEDDYYKKAEACYRGVLSLFRPDGSASCAYVYPVSVNGREAAFYDPYANDQDWGLYLMLCYCEMNRQE